MNVRAASIGSAFAILLAVSSSASAAARVSQQWSIGQEREVDEGIYFTLLKVQDGWRLWRIETQGGVECRAVKSARGKIHPFPIGAGAMFGFGEPYITLWKLNGRLRYSWKGVDFENSRVDVREVGQRFWREGKGSESYTDDDIIEVNITSWEYPAIRVGYHETKGTLDFGGWSAMKQAVDECDG